MNDDLQSKTSGLSPAKRALLERRLKAAASRASEPGSAAAAQIPKRPDRSVSPLSFAQERLWFFQQLQPRSTVFNMPLTARLRGRLDAGALEKTLQEILRRHEILRTGYAQADRGPVQRVNPFAPERLEIVDRSGLSAAERDKEARRLAAEDADLPFDLSGGRLFRARLVRFDQEDHLLLLMMHHIAFDGWSYGVLQRELGALYTAFVRETPLPAEPAVQYADFAVWQRERTRGELLARQLDYWKQNLRGAPAFLELPADRPRPAVQTYRGGSIDAVLDPRSSEKLHALCHREGTTLYILLLAAFQLHLRRLTGQEDIVVGMPIAGRHQVELEGLLGFFLNTLPLRTDVSGNVPFTELLARARATALGAFANQDIPFEKLVEELHPQRSTSHSPVFQVMLNMLDFSEEAVRMPGLSVELPDSPVVRSPFDLTIYVKSQPAGIGFHLVYNRDLFSEARMAEMLAQFTGLLRQIAERPETPIGDFSLLTASAQKLLPDPSEKLSVGAEEIIHRLFERQAEKDPGRMAVFDAHGSWTYGELDACANRIAHFLLRAGVRGGDVIAVHAHRSASLVAALLGVLKAGAAFVVFDPAYPASRLADMLDMARPKAWIELELAGFPPPELEKAVAALNVPRLRLPASGLPAALEPLPADPPAAAVRPDDLAYLAFTSGSTGRAKGVAGAHRPVSHFVKWHAKTFGLNESDRFAMFSGLAHDPLLRDIFTPLSIGASLHVPELNNIASTDEVADWMRRSEITVAHLTPAFGQLLATDAGSGDGRVSLPRLRYAFFGADVLTSADVERVLRLAPSARCVNFYGATETPQAIAFYPVDAAAIPQTVPLGRGIDGVQLLVLNAARRMAGIGEAGELCVRTPYLSRGYWRDEQLTRERFVSNPFTALEQDLYYRTGDLARYLPDGAVAFAGRADHQVKIRGFRVELGEVEAALRAVEGVREAAAVAREGGSGRQIVGYVAAEAGRSFDPHELRLELRGRLPDYMIPAAFVTLDTLPLTPNGKVDYRRLPEPEAPHPERASGYVAPRDPVEELLCKIWAEVLGLKKVGIHDNFFDLGGHSLLSLQIINQIHKAGLWVTAAEFFQNPTIAHLAAVVTTAPAVHSDEEGWSSLVPLRTRGSKPPLFLAHTAPGDVLGYINLVNLMDEDQPCYGFQSLGFQSLEKAHHTLEEMAAHYVKLLRRFQPEGPYYLAGWCFGGILAMEMADQLSAQGQKIGLLALFETWAHPPARGRLRFYAHRLKCFLKMGWRRKLRYMKMKFQWFYALHFDKARYRQAIEERFGFSMAHGPLASREQIYRINLRASMSYPSRPYDGRITLFNSIDVGDERIPDPTGGFATLVNRVEIHPVPGQHMSVLKDPHVRVLSDKLKACLRKAHSEQGVPAEAPGAGAVEFTDSLTQNQMQVWLAQKLNPQSLYYHVGGVCVVEGALDAGHFQNALRTLVRSSDALRTVIVERDMLPLRKVLSPSECSLDLECVDFSSEADSDARLREWVQRRISQPFDLSRRLHDFALIRLAPNRTAIYVVCHHLASDGWSIALIIERLGGFYGRSMEGKLCDIEPLPLYEDYVLHEREREASGRHDKDLAYWRQKLGARLESINFYGRPALKKSTLIRRIGRQLGPKRSEWIRRAASDARYEFGSLPNLFFTALAAYLHAVSGRHGLLIGVPFHNRRTRAFKQTIGFFSEVLPLRLDIEPNETTRTLAGKIRRQVIESVRHSPFSPQAAGQGPSCEAILNFHASTFGQFCGMPARAVWADTGHGPDSLAVQVHDMDETSEFQMDFDCHQDVFTGQEAARAADDFLGVLDAMLERPGLPLLELPIGRRETVPAAGAVTP